MTAEDGEYWAELERKSNEAARVLLDTAVRRIGQLERALVEERARANWGADGNIDWEDQVRYSFGHGDDEIGVQDFYRRDARKQLEESGILLNVDKLQNGSN